MNGIIYCRVSSKEQIDGTSLESQEAACREYARHKKIDVLQVFIERGESAKFADRTQLLELMEFCRRAPNKVDTLLVWKLDRLARNVGDHFSIKASLGKYGIQVVSVTEPIDAKPEGKLLETILAGFAQFDNDIRAVRTVQGMKRKIQEGIFPWKPPLGYKSSARDHEKKTAPDQPDQPLFGLLQKAWDRFATGDYTKTEITRLMMSWDVRTKTGNALSRQLIHKMFSNPYYAGVIKDPWSGEQHPAKHLPMINWETFTKVQSISSDRSHAVPHKKICADFPLRRFVRCPSCHSYLTASFCRGRSQRYPYYHCTKRRCMDGSAYPQALVHQEFTEFLASVSPTEQVIQDLRAQLVRVARDWGASEQDRKKRIEVEAKSLKRQTQELINMRTGNLITDQEFVVQKNLLSGRLSAITSDHTGEVPDEATIAFDLEEITAPLLKLPETWERLPMQRQNRFQQVILPVGYVYRDIGTADLGRLFSTFRRSARLNATAVASSSEFWNQLIKEIRRLSELLEEGDDESVGLQAA